MAMLEQKETIEAELGDEDFIEVLVEELLPQVRESLSVKEAIVTQQGLTKVSETEQTQQIGGNLESHQVTGLEAVRGLCTKLEDIKESGVDLRTVDFVCLERVLSFLLRRSMDTQTQVEYQEKLARLQEIKHNLELGL